MLKNQKGFSVVEVLLIVVAVALVGFTGWYVVSSKNKAENIYSKADSDTNSALTTLSILSDPTGVEVSGTPHCDGQKLKKTTPYDCTVSSGGISTSLFAPDLFSFAGQAYKFKTWDGCSESNPDKKICKVEVKAGAKGEVKVSYEKTGQATVSTLSPIPESEPCKKDEGDSTYRTCTLAVTEVPKKVQISALWQNYNGSQPSGSPKTKEEVTCNPADACKIVQTFKDGIYQNFSHTVTVSKEAKLTIKYPRDVHFFYCGIGCSFYTDQDWLLQKFEPNLPKGADHEIKISYKYNGCTSNVSSNPCQ